VWAAVAVVALLCKNIVRSRPGRALQAVRDRDVAAEVVGVSLFTTKVGAFVLSSAIATMAGVFYGIYLQYVQPDETLFGLNVSIGYLAIIIVGGIGTIYGPIVGALLIGALPALIDEFADNIPFVTSSPATESGISKPALQSGLYAVLIIVFLVSEPNGLAGLWRRARGYFLGWPLAS
jgi:branched-chain amino acid transport system permease protein